MRLYAEVRLNLLIMIGMNTKRNKNTQKIMSLFYNLMDRKNKSARVKMRMIKNADKNNDQFYLFYNNLPLRGRS